MSDACSLHSHHAPFGSPKRPGALRILVVEDHIDSAESLVLMLTLYGFEVRVAHDGPAALEMARADQPDVVLLDIGLPGLNGYEVAKRLPELAVEKRPLLIAVTGYGRDADRRRSEQAGIDLHLVKPVDPDQLLAVLRRFQTVLAPGPHRARQMV